MNTLSGLTALVEEALVPQLESLGGIPPELLAPMRYSLSAGGKRLRPVLLLAAHEALGGRTEDALPYVLNFSAGRVRSETMLHFLEERGVYVSSGSACAKGKPSHVLSAMGLSRERADSALRVSFSKFNTKEDIDALCDGIELGLKVLRHR